MEKAVDNLEKLSPIVKCTELVKLYNRKPVINGINFTIERGRIIGLLGPNGSGKTTVIKLIAGLLVPDMGSIEIGGMTPGIETKKIISYLPERTYLNDWMKVRDIISFFKDFYSDFDEAKAYDMLKRLNVNTNDKLKTMSKGTKEKVQLILVMSRNAELYLLDEPIGGVDPASRDYIIRTIINNYNENASVIITTHLISDIENILDDVVFLHNGEIKLYSSVDDIRQSYESSVDDMFREMFKC